MNPLLNQYSLIIDFLAEILGKEAEVVLHDVEDIDHSVVAIRNGNISGRTVGSPATNIVLKIIKDGGKAEIDYLTNYRGLSSEGKSLRSSTFFIRDETKKLIGILCVNIDITMEEQARKFIENIPRISGEAKGNTTVERFSKSVEDLALDSIDNAIKESGIPPKRMSQEEKISTVKKLNENGVFLLKGTVSRVAARLYVSEATIYRYLNGIKKEG